MADSRYIIGIDLGTTNSSVAYIDRHSGSKKLSIGQLEIPQVISEGEVSSRFLLPSFLYFSPQFEVSPGRFSLPWDTERSDYCVGEFARSQAARIAGRVVSSAKSWLCHRHVDRTAKILPWGCADPAARRVSPVEASSLYLSHLKDAWNYQIAKENAHLRMEHQEIILTVPASFDEVARELTLEAAHSSGLQNIILIEEPQAAFYSWLYAYESSWRKLLKSASVALVIDIGGGTTDLTLIRIVREEGALVLKRIAVGEHLLLGGDNMDIALARVVEEKCLGGEKKLDSLRWSLLCHECRTVKEKALAEEETEEYLITLPGRGSRLVGEAMQARLTREETLHTIVEGFFPDIRYDEEAASTSVRGLREWGLPYARDPSITRHVASFLRTHLKNQPLPDALLFNGGALKAGRIQSRIVDILKGWHAERGVPQAPVRILSNKDLDLSVSQGAAYFGRVRLGEGIRIAGGIPRSYYMGIDLGGKEQEVSEDSVSLLCLIPKDLPTESEVEILDREFSLILGRPVSFSLYSSTFREEDSAGKVLTLPYNELEASPPLFMVLESQSGLKEETPVHLKAWVTEIGTLELWCVSRNSEERWKLQFALNKPVEERRISVKRVVTRVDPLLLEKSRNLLSDTFMRKPGKALSSDVKPRGILYTLEDYSHQKREQWSTAYNRELFDTSLKVMAKRRSSPQHEASWLNIAGFTLRPGFGYPLDEWRIGELWPVFQQWLQFGRDPQCRLEWWIMWRRVAGGLDESAQEEILSKVAPYFFPGKKHIKTFPGPPPNPVESLEILRLAASCEKISAEQKIILGNYVMELSMSRHDNSYFWLIARIGSRTPFSGSIHNVLCKEEAEEWVRQILKSKWRDLQYPAFALSRLSRMTGDRERDINEDLRKEVAHRLEKEKCGDVYIAPLLEVIEEEPGEQNMIFGESLPTGLVLR